MSDRIDAIIEELRDEEDCVECNHSRAAHDRSWRCSANDEHGGCRCRGFVAPTCEHCGRELEGRQHLPQGGYCVLAPIDDPAEPKATPESPSGSVSASPQEER